MGFLVLVKLLRTSCECMALQMLFSTLLMEKNTQEFMKARAAQSYNLLAGPAK